VASLLRPEPTRPSGRANLILWIIRLKGFVQHDRKELFEFLLCILLCSARRARLRLQLVEPHLNAKRRKDKYAMALCYPLPCDLRRTLKQRHQVLFLVDGLLPKPKNDLGLPVAIDGPVACQGRAHLLVA